MLLVALYRNESLLRTWHPLSLTNERHLLARVRTPHRGPEVRPVREPTGPDGTKGFSSTYQAARTAAPLLVARGDAHVHLLV